MALTTAAKLIIKRVTQKDLAAASDFTEVTVIDRYKWLKKGLSLDFGEILP